MAQILYHSGPCIVALKPAGLLTQAPAGIDSLEAQLKNYVRATEEKTGNVYLGMPHRLDRPVSGPVVVTRHVRAAQRLSVQFENRTVLKRYWACVSGVVEPEHGVWRDRILKIQGQPRGLIVDADQSGGRDAELSYRVLGTFPWGTWLEVELHTGRYHQIRVQASSRGHAVLGDTLYGAMTSFGPPVEDFRQQAIALHGRQLEFLHPMTRETVSIIAPLAPMWRELGLPLGESEYLKDEGRE